MLLHRKPHLGRHVRSVYIFRATTLTSRIELPIHQLGDATLRKAFSELKERPIAWSSCQKDAHDWCEALRGPYFDTAWLALLLTNVPNLKSLQSVQRTPVPLFFGEGPGADSRCWVTKVLSFSSGSVSRQHRFSTFGRLERLSMCGARALEPREIYPSIDEVLQIAANAPQLTVSAVSGYAMVMKRPMPSLPRTLTKLHFTRYDIIADQASFRQLLRECPRLRSLDLTAQWPGYGRVDPACRSSNEFTQSILAAAPQLEKLRLELNYEICNRIRIDERWPPSIGGFRELRRLQMDIGYLLQFTKGERHEIPPVWTSAWVAYLRSTITSRVRYNVASLLPMSLEVLHLGEERRYEGLRISVPVLQHLVTLKKACFPAWRRCIIEGHSSTRPQMSGAQWMVLNRDLRFDFIDTSGSIDDLLKWSLGPDFSR